MSENLNNQRLFGLKSWLPFILLGGAVLAHFQLVTMGWEWGFMIGHEFRQTQTALITYFIDQQNNFSIDYETPLFGPPWKQPLELPVYQWVVVLVMRGFELPDFEAARSVSAACFYLALPAIWLLLKRCRLTSQQICVVISLVLVCPVYIFYSRAFLIDPMAFLFSAWFLLSFVSTMDSRRIRWFVACTILGTLAALLKSLVFLVWLFPAFLYGINCLWTNWKAGGRTAAWQTVLWGMGVVVIPLVLLHWWVGYTDAIKSVSPVTAVFTSEGLSSGNFGLFSLEARFSWHTWHHMFIRWSEVLTVPWVIGLYLLAGVMFCQNRRWAILTAFGLFMFGQLTIPYAYMGQDYYFYACAVFAVIALGFAALGFWEKVSWPHWLRSFLFVVPFAALTGSYLSGYYPLQQLESHGGSGLTDAMGEIVPEDGVVVIQGDDWSAIRPYYMKRKSFMIRNGMERNADYMDFGLANLRTERVEALIVSRDLERQQDWSDSVTAKLGLNSWPTMGNDRFLVYFHPIAASAARQLLATRVFNEIELIEPPEDQRYWWGLERSILPGYAASAFPVSGGVVTEYRIAFGYSSFELDERWVQNFHADSHWLIEPKSRDGWINLSYGLSPDSYQREGDKTSGVSFLIFAVNDSLDQREIFREELRPVENPADRGFQSSHVVYSLNQGESIKVATDAMGSEAFDWAYLESVEFGENMPVPLEE